MEKRYLVMWMWLCEGKLKLKTAHFRLPFASQKRACLSSLMSLVNNAVGLPKQRNSYQSSPDFRNKGTRTSPARLSFVLKVPLRYLRPSVIYSVPCDRIVQRACLLVRRSKCQAFWTGDHTCSPEIGLEIACNGNHLFFKDNFMSYLLSSRILPHPPAKYLRRMCCLCNYICKWLDVQVFSDKDYKP